MVKQSLCFQKKQFNWDCEAWICPLPFKMIHCKQGPALDDKMTAIPRDFWMLFEKSDYFLKVAFIVRPVFLSVNLNRNILICKDTDTFLWGFLQYINVLHGNDLSGWIKMSSTLCRKELRVGCLETQVGIKSMQSYFLSIFKLKLVLLSFLIDAHS